MTEKEIHAIAKSAINTAITNIITTDYSCFSGFVDDALDGKFDTQEEYEMIWKEIKNIIDKLQSIGYTNNVKRRK